MDGLDAIPLAGVAALALITAWLGCRLVPRIGWLAAVIDVPNARSLHERPVARTGGLAILAAAVVGVLWAALWVDVSAPAVGVAAGAGVVASVSFLDDAMGIGVGVRLAVQVLAAVLAVWALAPAAVRFGQWVFVLPAAAGYVLALLWIVWMTNLYNFMDGMDGFAGGMTVAGFGVLASIGAWQGDAAFAMVGLAIAAAAGGFLWYNFPPARLFMGDVGSGTLGYLAGVMVLWGAKTGLFPLWVGVLVFSPFVVDATVTLIRRLVSGERVWAAHRSHYYQRLVQAGWGHRKTVLAEYVLMVACGAVGWLAVTAAPAWDLIIALLMGAVYVLLAMSVRRLERSRTHAGWAS